MLEEAESPTQATQMSRGHVRHVVRVGVTYRMLQLLQRLETVLKP